MSDRWRVVITTGVFQDDYRALLARARIVFNRSIRSECNQRAFEATAAGALLFQEADNSEIAAYFDEGKEFVAYRPDNLEELFDYYLQHEDERRQIAEAGQRRAQDYSFANLWEKALQTLEPELAALPQKHREPPSPDQELLLRSWQSQHDSAHADPMLPTDLRQALAQPRSAALHHALAVALSASGQTKSSAGFAAVVNTLHQALQLDPLHVMARLNLAELLMNAGQKSQAVEQARNALAILRRCDRLSPEVLDAPHLPAAFDYFRVEWDRAAWVHAGQPAEEENAKKTLLRWQLHSLLASLTGDNAHYFEAAAARPDLPTSQAALGCALARANHFTEAVPHLQCALENNPFDLPAAGALFQALGEAAAWPEQHQLAQTYGRLCQAAPAIVPRRDWVAPAALPAASGTAPAEAGPVIWEGVFESLHSLALVNRQLCERLVERGYVISLQPNTNPGPPATPWPLSPSLANAFNHHLDKPAAVHIRHEWPPNWTPPSSGHWVVMQPWEYGSLPKQWIEPLKHQVDEVWVPTSWVRTCFIRSGVPADKVFVVPNGVDVALLSRKHAPFPLRTRKRFKFLFVGGTIHRKGFDVLLQAYTKTFTRDDDVCLVIKDAGGSSFYRGQTAEKEIAEHQTESGPEIEYLTQDVSAEEMASLFQSCHCLVHPYRGEGFGLPIAEAMASGLPVIVTGYGAALDFCDNSRAYLLPARLGRFNDKRVDSLPTVDVPWLAEPDLAMLGYYLRHVVNHPEEASAKGQAAASFVRRFFSWDRAADAVAARLEQLRRKPIRRPQLRESALSLSQQLPPGRLRPKVSLCMIVKNEEKHLEACLGSVADLVDEMIVIDTGSTDRTKEIAQKAGAQVHVFTWVDSFAAARNESLNHAAGDWILWLDADERLDETNRGRLRHLLANLKDENLAYVMRQFSKLEVDVHAAAQVDQVRLFRNRTDIRWQYRVHEQILLSVRRSGGDVRLTDIIIDHGGYSDPATQGPKVDRNLRLLELELTENPDDAFVLYNLGAVRLTQGHSAQALDLLRRSLQFAQPGDVLIRKLHALITRAHHQLGQKVEALKACHAGLSAFAEDGELLFWNAMLLREQNDLDGAAACLERVLVARPAQHFTSVDAGLYGYRARHFLAEVYRDQGKLREAEAQWQAAVQQCPSFTPAWLELARLFDQGGRWKELAEALPHLESDPQTALEALVLSGRVHLARKEYPAAQSRLRAAIAKAPNALFPRVLLSHALLQEGADWAEAGKARQDALALDPNNREVQHNLQVLRHQRQAHGNGATVQPIHSPLKVSLCMIVRNEEKNLQGCLQSVAGLVEEIIVVDTGSTDRTKEIALQHGAKVVDFPWINHFAAARNESLRHASREWVFWLDADDRLDEANRTKLRELFAGLKDEMAGYVMKCLCLPDGQGVETVVDHLRLFRNHPELRWTFRVHEQILPALRKLQAAVRWSDVVIHHTGYQNSTTRRSKLQRDLRLLELERSEQPDHPFTLFNLGNVYQEIGRTAEALEMFQRSLDHSAPEDSIVRKLYALTTQCHRGLGQKKEALVVCRKGLGLFADDIELLFQEGMTLRELGDISGAAVCWEHCLSAAPAVHFASVNTGLHGHITRDNLAAAYRDLGRLRDAEAQWKAALKHRPDYEPTWRSLLALYLEQKRWSDVEQLAGQLDTEPRGHCHAAAIRGRLHVARMEFVPARQLMEQAIAKWPKQLEPRVILSHALLQEGKDWPAAEATLHGILALDPQHKEAKHNLAVLRQQRLTT